MAKPGLMKAMAVGAVSLLSTPGIASDYLLGPQDKLQVKVYDWRSGSGSTHEWAGLVGEFTVNSSGSVAFPIVGELQAAHQTTSHLAAQLAARLRDAVGLAQAPVASVEVLQYRPFYIVGDVEKPGEYAFRPGLTVLQSLALAGGVQRLTQESMSGFRRDALVSLGDLRTMKTDEVRLKLHLMRLEAELVDPPALFFGDEVASDDADLKKFMVVERAGFDTFFHQKDAQRAANKQQKEFLTEEIANLTEKAVSVEHQIETAKKDMQGIDGLVARGLAVSSRQTALQDALAQYNTSRLDIVLALSRARQDIVRADRDLADYNDKTRAQVLSEIVDSRTRLAALAEKIQTAQALREEAVASIAALGPSTTPPQFFITRVDDAGKRSTFRVGEGELVQPGDTLKLVRPLTQTNRFSLAPGDVSHSSFE